VGTLYGVRGYPTMKIFKDGRLAWVPHSVVESFTDDIRQRRRLHWTSRHRRHCFLGQFQHELKFENILQLRHLRFVR
jgi:ribosomal protein L24E